MSSQPKTYLTPEEYLALERQAEYKVEQYVKQADGRWLLSDIHTLAGMVELGSIQCTLALADVYDKVVLP
jgi:predicted anti-sigma-YlaC factor YlaD